MREFKPPHMPDQPSPSGRLKIFAGGSIEMGGAEDRQKKLAAFIATLPYADHLDLFNPRRDDWDATWPNDYNFAPFKAQVEWELNNQKDADVIVYYFAGQTLSPITLLELGLYLNKNPVVGFDSDYKRAANLMVTKDHFPMDIHEGWNNFTRALQLRLDAIARDRGWNYAAKPPSLTP